MAGCDFSPGMLRQARARAPQLSLVQGDAERLPFADGSSDALVSTEAFEAAGFEVSSQRRILRLPAPVLFPPVLTEAVRRGQ